MQWLATPAQEVLQTRPSECMVSVLNGVTKNNKSGVLTRFMNLAYVKIKRSFKETEIIIKILY